MKRIDVEKMKLEDIGFYTLSDERALNVAKKYPDVPYQNCELIVTEKCNYKCSYCRDLNFGYKNGDIPLEEAKRIIDIWAEGGVKNIRLSGGEPTLYLRLLELVRYIRSCKSVERIGISTNGSADLEFYKKLVSSGVNDFGISLDACCQTTSDIMAGIKTDFKKISDNIRELSKLTYVTAGVVIDERNFHEMRNIIDYAVGLGVSDVRLVTSAQYNKDLELEYDTALPILKYRLNYIKQNRSLRGINTDDCNECHLVKDDMVVCGGYHFPCAIYMREHGDPIGKVSDRKTIQKERFSWFENTDTYKDPICREFCLDFCNDYNNKVELHVEEDLMPENLKIFLKELYDVCKKHDIYVGGCGHCGSPFLFGNGIDGFIVEELDCHDNVTHECGSVLDKYTYKIYIAQPGQKSGYI